MVQTPITKQWIENEHYELIPDHDDKNEWQIRILVGDYNETVISYGKVHFGDDGVVTFDYTLVYSPDEQLTEDDPALQLVVGQILHSIIVNAISEAMEKETESGKS